jgi:hypothetical protein
MVLSPRRAWRNKLSRQLRIRYIVERQERTFLLIISVVVVK